MIHSFNYPYTHPSTRHYLNSTVSLMLDIGNKLQVQPQAETSPVFPVLCQIKFQILWDNLRTEIYVKSYRFFILLNLYFT